MTFRAAIGLYLRDAEADGRIASRETVRIYLMRLEKLATHVHNRSPHTIGREDIKQVLASFPSPASQAQALSIFTVFFDWCEQEGHIATNPARKVRRPRVKRNERFKLTLDETVRVVAAAKPGRETRAIYLGVFAGLRNAEMRGVQGRHFQRDGFIWVSKDIAKGQVERWVPVLPELEQVVGEIRRNVDPDDSVLPFSSGTLTNLVKDVMRRAGIAAAYEKGSRVGPHTLRHAFTDYVRRTTGDVAIAQALLGHASMRTTQLYLSKPSLDELRSALGLSPAIPPQNGPEQPVGTGVPVNRTSDVSAAPSEELFFLWAWLGRQMDAIEAYKEAFAR
jgi:integrase